MTRNQILQKRLRDTLKNLRMNEKSTVKGLLSNLEKTKIEITNILKGTKRFEMGYYRNILSGINEKIDEYARRMKSDVISGQNYSWNLGEKLMPSVLTDVGYRSAFGKLSDELLVTTQNFTADLIKNISKEMKDDISREIRRGILRGDDPFKVAREIDDVIGITKRSGYLNRSDIIARTEIGRVYSMARDLQDEEVVKILPEYSNIWRAGFNPRHKDMGGGRGFISHLDADGQVRKPGEPFYVGGEYLKFPKDPNGKPENVCGCNCYLEPYMPGWT